MTTKLREMKHWFLGVALALVAAPAPAAPSNSATESVLAAVDQWIENFKGCRVSDMDRMVTDDMFFVHSGGSTDDKAKFMTWVKGCNMKVLTMPRAGTRVRLYGDQTAVVTGEMTFDSGAVGGTMLLTMIWVKTDGTWRFAGNHTSYDHDSHMPRPNPKPKA